MMDNIKSYSGNLLLYMDNWKSNRERKSDIKIFSESFAVHRVIQQSLQQPKKKIA